MGRNSKDDGFNVRAFSKTKHTYQLIVKLKAIKCYERLLCYLSLYIPFLAYSLLLLPFCL